MKRILLCLVALPLFFNGCKEPEKQLTGDESRIAVNKFVYDNTNFYYLWQDRMPNIDYKKEMDSKKYFEKLVYSELDRWSELTDEMDDLEGSIQGVQTTFGFKLALGEFNNNRGTYFAFVRFVHPDSPAQKGGLKRGDIILKINGESITDKNLNDLFTAATINLGLGQIEGTYIMEIPNLTVALNAVGMYLDPVNTSLIINAGTKKVGYLCYTQYISKSHEKLAGILTDFKNKGVTEIILDLRYNPGGEAITSLYLSSMLAPASALAGKKVFTTGHYSQPYTQYMKDKYGSFDTNDYFNKDVPVNLNLSTVYVLTTQYSASASEATIIGLKPYMNVVQIGTTTHGKYCAAVLLRPKESQIRNWGMMLVVSRFANSVGFTDFVNGLTPDYEVNEDYSNLYPFGDTRDPLVAKAMELITGVPAPASLNVKSKSADFEYIMRPEKEPVDLTFGMIKNM